VVESISISQSTPPTTHTHTPPLPSSTINRCDRHAAQPIDQSTHLSTHINIHPITQPFHATNPHTHQNNTVLLQPRPITAPRSQAPYQERCLKPKMKPKHSRSDGRLPTKPAPSPFLSMLPCHHQHTSIHTHPPTHPQPSTHPLPTPLTSDAALTSPDSCHRHSAALNPSCLLRWDGGDVSDPEPPAPNPRLTPDTMQPPNRHQLPSQPPRHLQQELMRTAHAAITLPTHPPPPPHTHRHSQLSPAQRTMY
jgi:hypothetical protein